jgi:hypothetical protein
MDMAEKTVMIVEMSFDPPLTDEEHDRTANRLDPCLEAHGAMWMRSYLSNDRRRMICHFEAADAEAVRESYRSAGMKFDRVWTASMYSR